MADPLEQMLEPGERVLWRSRWNWLPVLWPAALAVLGTLVYLLFWFDFEKRFLYAGLMGMVLAGWLINAFLRWRTRALITDRRVLYRGIIDGTGVTDLPLGEITRVEGPARPYAFRCDGEDEVFPYLRRGWHFARCMAQAAGVPYGPNQDDIETLLPTLRTLVWALLGSFLVILLVLWAAEFGGPEWLGRWAWTIFPAGLIAILAGADLAPALALALRALALPALRFFAPAELARDWLCQHAGTTDGEWVQPPGLDLALRWASLLYGRPLRSEDNGTGGGSHG